MKIKPAYSNSGPNNPASGPPISSVPPFFLNVRVIGKGNQILKLEKQKALFFSMMWWLSRPFTLSPINNLSLPFRT